MGNRLLPLAEPEALVGRRLSKQFAGFGRFGGEVTAVEPPSSAAGCTASFTVEYEDGDVETLPQPELLRLLLPPSHGAKGRRSKKKRARNDEA